MNRYKLNIKILILMVLSAIISCVDVDENYREFLEEGEILYTTKIDSIYSFAGNGRIQLSTFVTNAFSVNEFVVTYNGGDGNVSFPFTKNNEVTQRVDLIIPDLEERTYEFTVFTKDTDGNTSVNSRTFATSFGEDYRSRLTPRGIRNLVFDGTNGLIVWNPSNSLERGSRIKFINTSGEEVLVNASTEDSETTLLNLDPNEKIEYLSSFVPTSFDEDKNEETSIDEFESNWVELNLPLDLSLILQTITLSPGVEGTIVNWTNGTNLDIEVTAISTSGGEEQRTSISSSDTNGSITVNGLEDGQDFTILVSNASGNGFGGVYQAQTLTMFPSSGIARVLLPTDESGEHFGGSVELLFDGSTGNYYHSFGNSPAEFGHHFTLDFGTPTLLKGIKLWPRTACCQERNVKRYQLWGINDLTGAETTLVSYDPDWENESITKGWTLIHDSETPDSFEGVTTPYGEVINTQEAYRYVRYRAVTNHIDHKRTALAEMAFFIE